MASRAFNLLSAIFLLLCVAVVILWQRSYRGCDVLIGQQGPADHITVTSEFGGIVFEVEGPQAGQVQPGWSYFDKSLPRRFRKRDDVAGFAAWRGTVKHYRRLSASPLWGVGIPYWFVFLTTLIVPAAWAARLRRRRLARSRIGQGLCPRCGYDLRASQGRCPECGADEREKTRSLPKELLN